MIPFTLVRQKTFKRDYHITTKVYRLTQVENVLGNLFTLKNIKLEKMLSREKSFSKIRGIHLFTIA